MASFYFKAVASDGKVRTGTFTAVTEKLVASELRKQGLTPVYVGEKPAGGLAMKLPSIGAGRRKDVLLFTQELSTLLNAGVPVDRALSITSELTEKAAFRSVLLDVLRVLKGGKSSVPLEHALIAGQEHIKPDQLPLSDTFRFFDGREGIAFERLVSVWPDLAEFTLIAL